MKTQYPQRQAEEAIEELLQLHYSQECRMIRVDSPPGAGKTWLVQRLAVLSKELLQERCLIAVQTNAQAIDLLERMCGDFLNINFAFVHSSSSQAPAKLGHFSNLRCLDKFENVPTGPCIVVSTSAKCSWTDASQAAFDVLIVDEAFQLPDYRFHLISSLGQRLVLIGDPGQIDPVVKANTDRWRGDAAGPQIPCPEALLARHPSTPVFRLPVSRRLCPDTVDFVQPAFYPEHPFVGLSSPGSRKLCVDWDGISNKTGLHEAIEKASLGQSLLQLELPACQTQEIDVALVERMVQMVDLLFACKTVVEENGMRRSLKPGDVGIACAHVVQVSAIQERLHAQYADIYVETCDRFQGLERSVMLLYHPLSGQVEADTFHMDTGRMCVALSRHRISCFIFARAGIQDMLRSIQTSGERVLEVDKDPQFNGWRTHTSLLSRLQEARRVVDLE